MEEAHKCSTQHPTSSDKSRRKSRESTADKSEEWSRFHFPSMTQERISSEYHEHNSQTALEEVLIDVCDQQGSQYRREDTRNTKQYENAFIDVLVKKYQSRSISENMIDGNQDKCISEIEHLNDQREKNTRRTKAGNRASHFSKQSRYKEKNRCRHTLDCTSLEGKARKFPSFLRTQESITVIPLKNGIQVRCKFALCFILLDMPAGISLVLFMEKVPKTIQGTKTR